MPARAPLATASAGGSFQTDRATNTNIAQRIADQANAEISAAAAKAQGISGTDSKSTDALIGASNARLATIEGHLNELNDQTATALADSGKMVALLQRLVNEAGSSDPFAAARLIGAYVLS